MASVASIPYPHSAVSMDHQLAACGGCHNPVDDGDGVVVAFGNSLWHVDCFKCAKCGNRVSPDTNLLLLSDGSPVCAQCSYNCAICKEPISHEAIMTGDESYHAACFTCKTCGRHIGELVFAKTTQGIYCMSCHNERVARSRRHAEQRKHKHKPHRDGTRDKEDKLREKPSNLNLREGDAAIGETPPTTPGLQNPQITSADSAVPHAAKRISTQSLSATLHNNRQQGDLSHTPTLPSVQSSPTQEPPSSLPSPTTTTTYVSSHESGQSTLDDNSSLLKPLDVPAPRRKSFDDGVRPRNALLSPEPALSHSLQPNVANGMSRANKRSSINPGVRLDWLTANPLPQSQVLTLPPSASPVKSNTLDHLVVESPSPFVRPSSPQTRSHQASPISSTADMFCSQPTSPSAITLSQQRSQTEYTLARDRQPPSARKRSLPDTGFPSTSAQDRENTSVRENSLPDTALPYLHQDPSNESQLSDRGPVSPARSHTSQGDLGVFSQQQESFPLEQSIAEKSSSLDADDGVQTWNDDVDLEVSKVPYGTHLEESTLIPLGLPRMSFLGGDTNFHDLLQLGTGQSNIPVTPPERVDESKTASPNSDTPKPRTDTQRREEDKEAGPSKLSTAPTSITIPPLGAPPVTKFHNLPSPLTTLPRRNESLSRKMSARKPVPKAIVLPDTFEEDMALDLDAPSTGATSPGLTPGRSDAPARAKDVVQPPPRHASAEAESSHPPPLSPRSTARRASATISPPPTPGPARSTPMRSISSPPIHVADSGSSRTARPAGGKQDTSELVAKRIKEALAEAQENGATSVRLDREFLEVISMVVQAGREKLHDMRGKFDGMRRASQQYIDGLSVAQEEYDNELVARREAEAEVTRLKVQLTGQAARLTELSAGERKRDVVEQMSRDMSASLQGLERDLSKLKAERDLTMTEIEELATVKTYKPSGQTDVTLQRSLTSRFDNLKTQYKRELEPLVQQREALLREINELKEERNICLEETTALNARNEELVELNARTARQLEFGTRGTGLRTWSPMPSSLGEHIHPRPSTPKNTPLPPVPPGSGYTSSTLSVGMSQEDREEPRATPTDRKKWFKTSKEAIRFMSDGPPIPEKENLRHNFQQLTVLRFIRCGHCGDKMWGTQLRCTICNIGCHNRCAGQLALQCVSEPRPNNEIVSIAPLQPSMFGRDLIEQVRADSAKEHRDIPMIVEKCISAVELNAMDYEGIYRKTGGSSQSKTITQLFERGDYDAFDLCDSELFNDISSVTSVLKTYFRQLPNPLLTHALHEAFVGAANVREPRGKAEALSSLVYQLPSEHFHTLRYLMLHLYRIQSRCTENLMTARNLGMVFGPTLMRSSDLNREYASADMAGKNLTIEWLIENAPSVFREDAS